MAWNLDECDIVESSDEKMKTNVNSLSKGMSGDQKVLVRTRVNLRKWCTFGENVGKEVLGHFSGIVKLLPIQL